MDSTNLLTNSANGISTIICIKIKPYKHQHLKEVQQIGNKLQVLPVSTKVTQET